MKFQPLSGGMVTGTSVLLSKSFRELRSIFTHRYAAPAQLLFTIKSGAKEFSVFVRSTADDTPG